MLRGNFVVILWLMLLGVAISCRNEKVERKLIGDWEVVNSTLAFMESGVVLHESVSAGFISFKKNKIDNNSIDLNEGVWDFSNFPDTLISPKGFLSWTSTDKGDFKDIAWEMDIFFSQDYQKDVPVQGSYFFDSFQGKFSVVELKKKNHYRLSGYIYRPNKPYYTWVFELKKK